MRTGVLTFLLCCAICALPACGRKILVYGSGGGSTFTQSKDAVIPVTGTKGEQASLKPIVPSVQAPKPGATTSVPPRRKAVLHLSSDSLNTGVYSSNARPKVEKARQLLLKAESLEQEEKNNRNVWGYLALGGMIGIWLVAFYYMFDAADSAWVNAFGTLSFLVTPASLMLYLAKSLVHPVYFRKRAAKLIFKAPRSSRRKDFVSDSVYSLFALRDYLPARKLKRRLKWVEFFREFSTVRMPNTEVQKTAEVVSKLSQLESYAADRLKKEKRRMALRTAKHVSIILVIVAIILGIAIGIGTMEFGIVFNL